MSVDWSGYEPHRRLHTAAHRKLSRAQARAEYRHTLATRPDRIEQLGRLLGTNGITLGHDDESVQRLDDWFQANVRADPARLRDPWPAVSHDIGLFLGDLMVARFPALHWGLCVWGRRDLAYHRPVIMGFTRTPNPKYHIDPERVVSTRGHRAAKSLANDPGQFVRMLELSDEA